MAKEREIESGIKAALQGLAFWISYRQILYGWYPLNEGALVVEFVNLLRAKLDKKFNIYCEKQFDELEKKRMDVQIKQGDLQVAAIEFKRYSAGRTHIHNDMKKLLKLENRDVSRFVVVVSEKKRPSDYVNKGGKAITGNLIQKGEGNFSARVRRVLKSVAGFGKEGKKLPVANYCCLIEVLPLKT